MRTLIQSRQWLIVTALTILIFVPICLATEITILTDANSNIIYDGTTYREYNALNQLERIYNGSSASAPLLESYLFDPIEERIALKRVYHNNGSLKESVYYFGPEDVRVVNETGTYDFEYIYHEGSLIAQKNPDGTVLYFGTSPEGSTSIVTNSTGAVVEYTDYDVYGNILEGGTVSRFDSEAKEYDSLVGDYDFHFRKMKPEWGIFLQPDQLVIPKPYSPQSLNRYMFELGNPGTNIDPDGKESFYIGGGLTEGFSIGMGKGDGLSFKGNVFSGYTISTYDRDSNGGATPQAEASLEFGWSLSDKGFAGESTDYSLEVGFIRKGGITLSVPKYGNIQSKIAGSSIGGSIGRGLEVPVQGSKMDSTTKDTKIGQIPGLFDIAKVATAAYGKAAAAKQSVINRLAKVYGFKKASGSKK